MPVKLYFCNGPAENEKPLVVDHERLPQRWYVDFLDSEGFAIKHKTAIYKLAQRHDGGLAGDYIHKRTENNPKSEARYNSRHNPMQPNADTADRDKLLRRGVLRS